MSMLHSGSHWPANVNPIPSPAVPVKQEMPAIMVLNFFSKFKKGPTPTVINPDEPPPLMVEEHWVTWVKKGEQQGSTCTEAIKRLCGNPDKNLPPRIEWLVIGPAYEAWRKGEAAPVAGQALYSWAGISRELADELKKFNIYTVEDLANMQDHRLTQVPIPGLREIRQRAKTTIEFRETSEIGAIVAERDEKIALLEKRDRENDARIAALQATVDAMARQAGIATQTLTANMPHPDDEFVQRGPNDSHVGNVSASNFSRRSPVDHIDAALGEVTGEHIVAPDDGDVGEE